MKGKIQNNHNVYILGAGFSAPRGLPVIANFMFALRDAHEWLEERNREWEAHAIQRVLEFRREATPAAYRVSLDLENIETLFSLASATGEEYSDDIRIAIAATLDYCQSTSGVPRTRYTTSPPKSHPENARQWTANYAIDDGGNASIDTYDFFINSMLGRFSRKEMEGKNTFVTLNYDTLIEKSLEALGIPFSYGFKEGQAPKGESRQSSGANSPSEVLVLKLHGSNNWTANHQASSKMPQGSELEVVDSYETLRNREAVPALVPPTWRKSISGQLQHVWRNALNELADATRVIILGFSIPETDVHFQYLLAAALRENISLREIVFVNKAAETLRPRLVALFGDLDKRPVVRSIQTSAGHFLSVGMLPDTIYSTGRNFPSYIQGVSHGAY